jgi:hypothetical protein
MRTCVLAHTETLPANKITKKSGKNRDGHLKQKKERTYALFQCVHAYMCTRSKKSQPQVAFVLDWLVGEWKDTAMEAI